MFVNGVRLLVILTSVCVKLNILTISVANKLQLEMYPSSVLMKGFCGGCLQSMGKSEIAVLIDNVILEESVEITDVIYLI